MAKAIPSKKKSKVSSAKKPLAKKTGPNTQKLVPALTARAKAKLPLKAKPKTIVKKKNQSKKLTALKVDTKKSVKTTKVAAKNRSPLSASKSKPKQTKLSKVKVMTQSSRPLKSSRKTASLLTAKKLRGNGPVKAIKTTKAVPKKTLSKQIVARMKLKNVSKARVTKSLKQVSKFSAANSKRPMTKAVTKTKPMQAKKSVKASSKKLTEKKITAKPVISKKVASSIAKKPASKKTKEQALVVSPKVASVKSAKLPHVYAEIEAASSPLYTTDPTVTELDKVTEEKLQGNSNAAAIDALLKEDGESEVIDSEVIEGLPNIEETGLKAEEALLGLDIDQVSDEASQTTEADENLLVENAMAEAVADLGTTDDSVHIDTDEEE